MKYKNTTLVSTIVFFTLIILQSHSDGRATRDRDNTGAPGGQVGGGGMAISCQNCHENGAFEVGLKLELLDTNNNPITEYIPDQTYIAKVIIESLSGNAPSGYGFQMASLIDSDDSDVKGWDSDGLSENVQLVLAKSTGRVYAEHNSVSTSNEFTAEWKAPKSNSGDVSFYVAGVGANSNGASSGDHAPTPIKVTLPESSTSSTSDINRKIDINIYPNPTSNYLNINGEVKSKIIEIYRQQVLIQSITAKNETEVINLTQLASGVYFIVVKNAKNVIFKTERIVKL